MPAWQAEAKVQGVRAFQRTLKRMGDSDEAGGCGAGDAGRRSMPDLVDSDGAGRRPRPVTRRLGSVTRVPPRAGNGISDSDRRAAT